jgi:hypothetical protein
MISRAILIRFLPVFVLATLLPSCVSTQTSSTSPAVAARNALIRAEPVGDYYIGRRYVTHRTRFWGYLRRPRQTWEDSKLTIMYEGSTHVPDRLPELPEGAEGGFEFDHNYEYKVWGHYTGKTIYDPNSDLFLPEFKPERFELITASPGFLFSPNQGYNPKILPPKTS